MVISSFRKVYLNFIKSLSNLFRKRDLTINKETLLFILDTENLGIILFARFLFQAVKKKYPKSVIYVAVDKNFIPFLTDKKIFVKREL